MNTNTVRAKFRVHNTTKQTWGTEVFMSPVYGDNPENKEFFEATPAGDIRMTIKNELASKCFENNKSYYVDFVPVD